MNKYFLPVISIFILFQTFHIFDEIFFKEKNQKDKGYIIIKSTEQKTKLALSLSDPGVVETFKDRFKEVFKVRKVDYLFCNKEEATSLVGNNFVKDLGDLAVNFVVTNGAESSFVVENGSYAEIKAKNVKAIDSNGAGDIFAGAALNKIIEEESFLNACKFGNYASSKIVQEKSPRLSVDQYKKLKADY